MVKSGQAGVADIFQALGGDVPQAAARGIPILSPPDGALLAQPETDTPGAVGNKVRRAAEAQKRWAGASRQQRVSFIEALSGAIRQQREPLAGLIMLEGGKTEKEALGEADGSADVLIKTVKDVSLAEFGGMIRHKERPPVGVVGLITSFNFPLVVANWTIAPALLAGNAVVWKPSEKTPLTALGYKLVFDSVAGDARDLLHIAFGARDVGAALVEHESVDMISATGSVGMGQGIREMLAAKENNRIRPILELGGNNGVVISDAMSDAHLEWSLKSLLTSFFGTAGQRCTNTRRLIVHKSLFDKTASILKKHIEDFAASGAIQNPLKGSSNDYGYGPLIDLDAFNRFEKAKARVLAEGGKIIGGRRLLKEEFPAAYYVEPALAIHFSQTPIMHEETFAPLLHLVPYEGGIDKAMALLNAPANAGLVSGIYTLSQKEADRFARESQAGHAVINSPKGTGTPAYGMGFGGNKESGEGEILNAADPLAPFTRPTHYRRVAQNKEIQMQD